jgi:hypothetical protein
MFCSGPNIQSYQNTGILLFNIISILGREHSCCLHSQCLCDEDVAGLLGAVPLVICDLNIRPQTDLDCI